MEKEEREMEIPRLCPLLQGTNATCGELAPEWSFDKNMIGGIPLIATTNGEPITDPPQHGSRILSGYDMFKFVFVDSEYSPGSLRRIRRIKPLRLKLILTVAEMLMEDTLDRYYCFYP